MQYLIKQKVFSMKDKFSIMDVNQTELFRVEGKMFSLKNKLNLLNMDGSTLFYAERKMFTLMPEYNIYSTHGVVVARVRRKFAFLKQSYIVYEGNNDIQVDGNFTGHNFRITKNGEVAADIDKKYFSFGDSYVIDVHDQTSALLYLFIVIVIDQVAQSAQRNSNA